ncbi:GHKL domain-containing protein [Haloarcula sp. JP-L23]|nr:GHKL domain-containing protein [Haloarcula sp. JP-L23]
MGVVEFRHIQKMSSSLGVAVFALLPFMINLGLIGAGIVLWRSRFNGDDILRVAGWVVLGMTVIGLLATWTITHQNIRGRPFAHAPFVTVNNLSAGGVIGFVIGWYDILRRRHWQQVETERARIKFLHSSLRHNVLNGLTVILGNVEFLEAHVDETATELESIRNRGQELKRFAEATSALMQNFHEVSDISLRPLVLSDTLTEEIEKAREQFDHAEFTVECPADIYIEGDDFVAELISNLLSNAVLHNDKPTPEVSVTARRADDTVVVRVADNGQGIPDEEKARMLEWNVKGVDSAGAGLGLAIANTVAERYDGTLWIEDNDPEGTVVNVELPVASHNASAASPEDIPTT